MTGEATPAGLAQRLRHAAAELPGEGVSLQWLAQAHGPAAQGSLLVLLAVPCLLPVPGSGTVVGMGICALAAALWRGRGAMALPQRVGGFQLSQRWAARVLRLLAAAYALAGLLSRPRLSHLATGHPHGLLAALVGVMAVIIVLPIPFGNVLPALALMLLGIGLVFHDGVAVLLGWLMSALALLGTTALFIGAWLLARGLLPAWLPWPGAGS
ncbi:MULTISPECIES: exopolysaccharide biosynthesis protein [Aquincola]|uniref:exopolysaccharide biosynthesis protein n=1 Tax=Aquincola TaxID=391952 RepID=UPI0018DC90F2|nr:MULTISPECIES: exopolysaccharide biosynthesis protein [Aquincola]MCR5868038.1 exopolysaccharide biosynthesis protein [Aquincola sp. J276]